LYSSVFSKALVFTGRILRWIIQNALSSTGVVATTAEIHQGGQREALLHAIGANETHGHRRSDADRRHAVTLMLTDPEWSAWANTEIARQCRVSEFLVRTVRHELELATEKPEAPKPTRTTSRKGKTYTIDTSRIGTATPRKRKASSPEPAVSNELPQRTDTAMSEPSAALSSIESKIGSEASAPDLSPAEPASSSGAAFISPPRPLTLVQLWQASTVEERQEFIVVCHEELRQLLTAYETPPPDHKATVAQQILAWHHEGMSQRAIAHRLNEEHISTISGRGAWNSGQVAKLLAKERQA
jgi:hypothetical protein